MLPKQRILISILISAMLVFGLTSVQAKEADLASSLNLSKEQIVKLSSIIEEFSAKRMEVASKMDDKFTELEKELKKEDRFDTKSKARAGARNFNKLVKGISSLYGDLLKLKVEYLLKAKDIFTDEQKAMVFVALLDSDLDMPDDFSYYLELDLQSLGLDLTKKQARTLLKHRANMEIQVIKLELEMDYKLLDLEAEILSADRDPQKANKIIIDIVDIGTKLIDNHVNHILKAKDVLTLEQKKELMHLMLIMSQY